jgi:hypothetical protein
MAELSEARRKQLDGIVQQMSANKEPEANVQTVVNDFKGKYATPEDPGFLSGLYESTVGPVVGLAGGLTSRPIDTLKGVATGLQQSLITKPFEYAGKTAQAIGKGDLMGAIRNAPGIVPVFGPAVESMTDMAGSGQPRRAAGNFAGLLGTVAIPEAAAALKGPIASAAKTAATEVLGKTTGVGAPTLRRAIDNPSADLTNAMRGGVTDTEMVGSFKTALQNVKDARSAEYQAKLQAIPQGGAPLNIAPIRATLAGQLQKFNVKIGPKGELDFSRSTIRDAAAQNEVKGIYGDVMDWGSQSGDLTLAGVDTLKRRIDDTYSPSSTARVIVQNTKNAARQVLDGVPGYKEMTAGYAKSSQFLDQVKDLSLESANPGTAVRKLTTLLNQNNGYRQMLAEKLSQYTPKDLEGMLAGQSMNRWAPRGIMGPLAGAGGAFELGRILFTHAANPMEAGALAVSAALASPRLMGELMTLISKAPTLLVGASGAARSIAPALSATSISSSQGVQEPVPQPEPPTPVPVAATPVTPAPAPPPSTAPPVVSQTPQQRVSEIQRVLPGISPDQIMQIAAMGDSKRARLANGSDVEYYQWVNGQLTQV